MCVGVVGNETDWKGMLAGHEEFLGATLHCWYFLSVDSGALRTFSISKVI